MFWHDFGHSDGNLKDLLVVSRTLWRRLAYISSYAECTAFHHDTQMTYPALTKDTFRKFDNFHRFEEFLPISGLKMAKTCIASYNGRALDSSASDLYYPPIAIELLISS
ncbi:uncharacterized protein LOC119734060 [Patiria miniata]|uniref:Uncharacterized protein n=1 Tax=Patiria miniata TaxID=46514 RepID=A0A914AIY4_PATMI|nr:uncharacterized protein LOC119734060 [Patiria miniata]